ncbi:type II toxin-antitoxin system prevent-host-death family antitoxin [Streptomyces viridochromogenes]|uniref:type II toxin-antitoxin system prevent-host-death family antitoxin n=1 Tax=Streptomyces viridochromogenes TaxID=1938 RepID=UPI002E0FE834
MVVGASAVGQAGQSQEVTRHQTRRPLSAGPAPAARSGEGRLGELARRAARHGHITLTDRGVPAAVLISPAELEDLEDSLALARLERDRALGRTEPPTPHDEARRALLEAAGRGA